MQDQATPITHLASLGTGFSDCWQDGQGSPMLQWLLQNGSAAAVSKPPPQQNQYVKCTDPYVSEHSQDFERAWSILTMKGKIKTKQMFLETTKSSYACIMTTVGLSLPSSISVLKDRVYMLLS